MSNVAIADIDFQAAKSLGNRLLDQLDAVRETSPVFWSEKQKSWIVTGHAQVAEGLRGTLPLSAAGRLRRVYQVLPETERHRIPYTLDTVPRFLISLDPPEQLRLRKLMLKAFSRNVAENHRPYAAALIKKVLDEAAARQEVEFVEDVARQIPGRIILRLMGLPDGCYSKLRFWTTAVTGGLAGGGVNREKLDACETALTEIRDVVAAVIAERRRRPDDGFISSLIQAEDAGQRLTDAEIISTCELTLGAGNDTTTNTISLGTVALAKDPAARTWLREHPNSIGNAIMELMRCVAMSTAQVRVVAEDFEWADQSLRKGDHVYLMIASANRDPSVFPDPKTMNFERSQEQNMTFGPGLHHCIGHFIAKMQLTEFFPALLARFDRIEILDDPLDWATALSFRGLQSLKVRLH